MRITGLRVDGFGVFRNLEIGGLSEGLNVFYGPNEAGKTTLMQFVRSVFYGFSPERRRYLAAVDGERAGGMLQIVAAEGRVDVVRRANRAEPAAGESVTVNYPDGTRQGEPALKTILGSIDEHLFNHVFCVGLRELQELGTLTDTQAATMLYHMSSGLGSISLIDVVRSLEEARNRILDAGGGPCEISRLLEQRNRLRAEIEQIGRISHDFGRLSGEQARVERDLAMLEEETRRLRHEVRLAEIAAAVQPLWLQRDSTQRQLAAFGPAESIPEDAVHRLESIGDRLGKRREYLSRWKAAWSKLCHEARALKVNETLERLAPRIEALREQEGWLSTLAARSAELKAEVEEMEARFALQRRQFGLSEAGANQLSGLSTSAIQALRRPARAIKRARAAVEEAQKALAQEEERALSLAEQVEKDLQAWNADDLQTALERQGQAVSQLRRRAQIDQRLEQMVEHQGQLEAQAHRLIDNQVMPTWMMLTMGGTFIAGSVLLLTLAIYSRGGFSYWGWPLAILWIIGLAAIVSTKAVWERASARRLTACRRQASMLEAQVKEIRREREHLDRNLPPGEGSIQQRLRAAEKELAELEAFVGRDAQRQAAQSSAESAAERLERAKQAASDAHKRWRQALVSIGLPADLAPAQVRDLLSQNEEMADLRRRLEHRYEELKQRNREREALARRIADLLAEAGLVSPPDNPAAGLSLLRRALAEQETRQKRLAELRSKARRLRRKRKRVDKSVRQLKSYRRRLLRAAGAADENQLRSRVMRLAEVNGLRNRLLGIDRQIEAAIGGYCPSETIAEALQGQSAETLRGCRQALVEKLAGAEKALRQASEQRGRFAEQLRLLSDDRGPAARQLEMNMIERQLADALHRWRVRAVACRTLADLRTAYERDRQPETLQEASDYLQRMTGGRYSRVWTPLDEDVLYVDDREGNSRSVEILSHGTREQLFICLRLALAAAFARRGAVMPLILDDVLVNFDVDRVRAAAAVMRDFAAMGHQVLLFTCHEHIQKIFKALKTPVNTLPAYAAPRRLEAARVESAPTKKTRTRPKRPKRVPTPTVEEPEPEPALEWEGEAEEPEEAPAAGLVEEPRTIEEPEIIELGEEDEAPLFETSVESEERRFYFDDENERPDETQEAEPDDLWEDAGRDQPGDLDDETPAEHGEGEEDESEEEEPEDNWDAVDDEEESDDSWEVVDDEEEESEDGRDDEPDEDMEEDTEQDSEEDTDEDTWRGSLRRRRHDDWDDRYEDEYDELVEEPVDEENWWAGDSLSDGRRDEAYGENGDMDDGGAEAA